MSKEFWEEFEALPLGFEEEDEPRSSGAIHESESGHHEARESTPSISLICPDTGRVRSHNPDDLRAQLKQFRLARAFPSSRVTAELPRTPAFVDEGDVAFDDELHGRDGEWLVVTEVSPDQRMLTLQCFHTGNQFKSAASAVQDDVRKRRLKIHRYGDPDIPPEF
jgi:hypothetical protein